MAAEASNCEYAGAASGKDAMLKARHTVGPSLEDTKVFTEGLGRRIDEQREEIEEKNEKIRLLQIAVQEAEDETDRVQETLEDTRAQRDSATCRAVQAQDVCAAKVDSLQRELEDARSRVAQLQGEMAGIVSAQHAERQVDATPEARINIVAKKNGDLENSLKEAQEENAMLRGTPSTRKECCVDSMRMIPLRGGMQELSNLLHGQTA